MSADECRRKLSLREVAAWAYLISQERKEESKQVTQPELNEYYLMQIALEVRQLTYCMSSTKKSLKLADFTLKFGEDEEQVEDDIATLTSKGQNSLKSRFAGSPNAPSTPDFEKWQQQSMKS